jgi:hypothetical protein
MILWFIVGFIVWTLCILLMLAVFHGGHRNREHGCEQKLYSRYMVNPQNVESSIKEEAKQDSLALHS